MSADQPFTLHASCHGPPVDPGDLELGGRHHPVLPRRDPYDCPVTAVHFCINGPAGRPMMQFGPYCGRFCITG